MSMQMASASSEPPISRPWPCPSGFSSKWKRVAQAARAHRVAFFVRGCLKTGLGFGGLAGAGKRWLEVEHQLFHPLGNAKIEDLDAALAGAHDVVGLEETRAISVRVTWG